MKHAIGIFVFTVVITGFYNYVGQLVPQKEVHPPKTADIRSDMSTEEMVEAGKVLVEGKGTCLNCHNGSERFPLLEGVGERAKTQKSGMNDVEYLAEALYEPNVYIVPPFAQGMPPVHKPPIGLSHEEILTVIAYLQSLGGTPSVTLKTKLKYQGTSSSSAGSEGVSSEDAPGSKSELTGKELIVNNGCTGCHSLDAPVRMLGPSLQGISKRLSRGELYESIVDPDAVIAEGFPPGVMGATLNGGGFYNKVSAQDLQKMVDFLETL